MVANLACSLRFPVCGYAGHCANQRNHALASLCAVLCRVVTEAVHTAPCGTSWRYFLLQISVCFCAPENTTADALVRIAATKSQLLRELVHQEGLQLDSNSNDTSDRLVQNLNCKRPC